MAENEYLGVGFGRAYRRARELIRSDTAAPDEIGSAIAQALQNRLRGNLHKLPPLKQILEAISDSRKLRQLIRDYPDQDLPRMVRDACANGYSVEPDAVAGRVVQSIFNGIVEETARYACKFEHNDSSERLSELCRALRAPLEGVRAPIANALCESLRGKTPAPAPRLRPPAGPAEHTQTPISRMSLISKPAGGINVFRGR